MSSCPIVECVGAFLMASVTSECVTGGIVGFGMGFSSMGSALVYKRTRSVKEYSFTDWSISEYSFIDGATDPIRGVRSWTVHKRTNLNKSSTSP